MELEDEWRQYEQFNVVQKPAVESFKSSLLLWMAYWPVDLLKYGCRDFVVHFFTSLYERAAGLYQRTIDRAWGDAQ
jgi:hypothetical protein